MRICLIASSRHPVRQPFAGGLESLTHQLAGQLVRRGHEVTLFAAPGSDPALPVAELDVRRIRYSPAALRDVHAPAEEWMTDHHAYLSLMLDIAHSGSQRFDVVHNNSLHHLPVAMSAMLDVPVLTTLHTPPTPWLESAMSATAAPVECAAVSRCTAAAWRHVVDATVVHNGVDLDHWHPGRGGRSAVWTGRLVAEKAPHLAIEAAQLAGIPLVLAGPATDAAYFAREIEPRLGGDVAYVGHLDHQRLAELVAQSAVAIVTPAWEEPFGLVAIEAMACGTPVAALSRGALPEIVETGTGAIAVGDDPADLAAAIGRSLTCDRRTVREHVVRSFSAARMVNGYENLYAELLPRHPVRRMIGYYIHHHGRGHAHRALALARRLDGPVTGLSSLPPPPGWTGDWVLLERDDLFPTVTDPTAQGRLHWAPMADPGLSTRTAHVSRWLDEHRPRLMVVDVSVEVALLARLHGVPVVSVVLPGQRADAAHLLGFDVSTHLVGMWPAAARNMLPGLPDSVRDRVHLVGAVSRYPVRVDRPRRPGPPRVLLMTGAGGDDLRAEQIERARRQSAEWEWIVLGRHGRWDDDPRAALDGADVVVTNAGQNSLAEIAAARTPAVVVPQARPHEEQRTSADALAAGGWPVLVESRFPDDGWSERLESALRLDGARWSSWCDGRAAERFADLVAS